MADIPSNMNSAVTFSQWFLEMLTTVNWNIFCGHSDVVYTCSSAFYHGNGAVEPWTTMKNTFRNKDQSYFLKGIFKNHERRPSWLYFSIAKVLCTINDITIELYWNVSFQEYVELAILLPRLRFFFITTTHLHGGISSTIPCREASPLFEPSPVLDRHGSRRLFLFP